MADFYGRMQKTASRLLKDKRQGDIIYVQPGATSGPAWDPVVSPPINHTLDATVSGVAFKYVDGSQVLATDQMVIAAVFGVEPSMSGTVTINGRAHQIVRIDRVPGSGTVVAWRVFVRS
jgi:hypothetical protein